tara:strand:- start:51 stop:248 length:198 start_codon:yes stop_codon:yes gene_type:complete
MEIDLEKAYDNYDRLSEEEKEIIRNVMRGPTREIIRKVFGQEFDNALGSFMLPISERGRGLATRT